MTLRAQDLVNVAQDSPRRVAAHDREGWLWLFARQGVVEDPVGTPPHRRVNRPACPEAAGRSGGHADPLAAFYDTFIGPNEIRFEIHGDGVAGLESPAGGPFGLAVARDVTIHTRVKGGLHLSIPAYLLYDLIEEDGVLKIRRLAAHWSGVDLPGRAIPQGLGGLRGQDRLPGLGGLLGLGGQTARMIRYQGLGAMAGYALGMARNVLSKSASRMFRFIEAVNLGPTQAPAALASLSIPAGPALGHSALAMPDLPSLARTLTQPGPLSAMDPIGTANTVAFRYSLAPGAPRPSGLAFLGFHPTSGQIAWARFFDFLTETSDVERSHR